MAEDLEKLFIHHINQNLGIAHKVSGMYFPDAEEREDAMQEMMYALWRSYPSFSGRSKFSTWMYRVCLNTALTYRRNNGKHKYETLSLSHFQLADHVSENADESIKLLLNAISDLTDVNKAIVLLYLEDLSYEEIASIMGMSRSGISVRLVRIKKELEKKLTLLIHSIK